MYLMIENTNEAPIESFTVFGASTSRGDDSCIGQFGSGAKFGVLVCMRFGLNPIIYSGLEKIEFFTRPMEMKGVSFSRVCYKYKGKAYETSYTLEFGALDWDSCHMGLREFVSNAIDNCDNLDEVSIKVSDNARASSGKTRVFIPLNPDVQMFYNDLPNKFLHFNETRGRGKVLGVLEKVRTGPAEIFHKGIFVRHCGDDHSLFDYNFGDELKIDESRNLGDYQTRNQAEKCLAKITDEKMIFKVLDSIVSGQKNLENSFGSFSLRAYMDSETWKDAFVKKYGKDATICSQQSMMFIEKAKNKGYNPILIPQDGWYQALLECGIDSVLDVLDDVNDQGHTVLDASPDTLETAKTVWEWLEFLEMTKGKEAPPVKEFVSHMDGGGQMNGYYKDGMVFMERESRTNKQVMLEEFAHYITGSTDNSRDFQDFAFKMCAAFGNLL